MLQYGRMWSGKTHYDYVYKVGLTGSKLGADRLLGLHRHPWDLRLQAEASNYPPINHTCHEMRTIRFEEALGGDMAFRSGLEAQLCGKLTSLNVSERPLQLNVGFGWPNR